mmetsp:Transcript_59901/g.194153  ORF Transcript_59901/g.194153 Transcript_59901/m.194153 type:complete len:576 (-) Transcript_59901:157-1884(-)
MNTEMPFKICGMVTSCTLVGTPTPIFMMPSCTSRLKGNLWNDCRRSNSRETSGSAVTKGTTEELRSAEGKEEEEEVVDVARAEEAEVGDMAQAAASGGSAQGEKGEEAEGGGSAQGDGEAVAAEVPAPAAAEPSRPLSWAERAALQAAATGSGAGYHASSSSTARPPIGGKMEDVKLAKDSLIDYLIFLAERRKNGDEAGDDGAAAREEVPEPLRKFEGSLASGIATSSAVSYTRLGLTNSANNCYLSVVIQSILPCNALMWILRRCSADDPRRPVFSCMVSLCKEFHTRKPDSHGDVLNLLVMNQVKEVVASWQRLGAQQDAGEFLFWLLSQMHDESKWKVHVPADPAEGAAGEAGEEDDVAPSAWATLVRTSRRAVETRSAGLHEDSPITRTFGGLTQSAVRTKGAKVDSVSLEPFNHLDLDISAAAVNSVRAALEAYCAAEEVNDGLAMRRMQFKLLPKVLVLNLKRFSFVKDMGGPQKIQKAIKYDEKLTLDKAWLVDDTQSPEYFMTAVICHHGESVHKGHYTAIVRYNAEWYMYDDTCVRRLEPREVGAQQYTVYLLVYQSRGTVDMTP